MHEIFEKIPWWTHQKSAIEILSAYIKEFNSRQTDKYSLITIPTGTGKTGIIAGISQLNNDINSALIIAPRVSLRDQLYLNIGDIFFSQFNIDKNSLPKKVISLDQHNPSKDEFKDSPLIIVTTIQKLVSMSKENIDEFNILKDSISMILFDEGHYAPAIEWSQIIKQFDCPTAIFTATPYRNDLKPFNISPEHSFIMTMDEAIENNIVRNLQIKSFPETKSDIEFIDNFLHFFEGKRDENTRALIRCNNSSEINRLSQLLIEKGYRVIGIHENFNRETPDWLFRKVPNPLSTPAEIWLHQYKLLEGIDDSRFRIAAIYGQLGNDRSIIQQIGRIIRNPNLIPNQYAWILDWDNHITNVWENFRKYDTQLRRDGKNCLEILTNPNSAIEFLTRQPTYFYFGRGFKTKLDFDNLNIFTDLQIPLSLNLYEVDAKYLRNNLLRLCIIFSVKVIKNLSEFDNTLTGLHSQINPAILPFFIEFHQNS